MKKFLTVVALTCCLAGCLTSDKVSGYSSKEVDKVMSIVVNDECLSYRLYFPLDMDENDPLRDGKLSLCVFLHDRMSGAFVGLDKIVAYVNDNHVKAAVLAPILPNGADWSDSDIIQHLNTTIQDILLKGTNLIDPNRVYLTGFGSGGRGVWTYALAHPEVPATIAPVCGGYLAIRTTKYPAVSDKFDYMNIWAIDYIDNRHTTTDLAKSIMSQVWSHNIALARYSVIPHGGFTDDIYSDMSFLGWIFNTRRAQ